MTRRGVGATLPLSLPELCVCFIIYLCYEYEGGGEFILFIFELKVELMKKKIGIRSKAFEVHITSMKCEEVSCINRSLHGITRDDY